MCNPKKSFKGWLGGGWIGVGRPGGCCSVCYLEACPQGEMCRYEAWYCCSCSLRWRKSALGQSGPCIAENIRNTDPRPWWLGETISNQIWDAYLSPQNKPLDFSVTWANKFPLFIKFLSWSLKLRAQGQPSRAQWPELTSSKHVKKHH